MITAEASSSRVRLLSAVVLVVAVVLCAVFMPAMAMAALAGCVAVIVLVTLARRGPRPVRARKPHLVERTTTAKSVMATGPPVTVPFRT